MTRFTRGRRLATWLAPALLLGTLAMAACSSPSTGGTGGNPDATTILNKAKAAAINDETYTIALSTTAAGQTNTLSVNGKDTKNPQREQLDMSVAANGSNFKFTLIQDGATKTDYAKFDDSGALGLPTGKWFKISASTGQTLSNGVTTLLDFSSAANPKLVGSEQINGVAVWHITASENLSSTPAAGTPAAGSDTGTADLYFRQDNFYPVKVVAKSNGADASSATITWSAINSGISISLPADSDVSTLPGA